MADADRRGWRLDVQALPERGVVRRYNVCCNFGVAGECVAEGCIGVGKLLN